MKDIDVEICEYIIENWIDENISTREFASSHDIDESTARKIKNIHKKHYSIPVATLNKMCVAREITLEKFFAKIKR